MNQAAHADQPAGRGQTSTFHRRAELPDSVPLRFGDPSRPLAGMYQPAGRARADGKPSRHPPTALLFCNPFGQEAIRSHRTFRAVSELLAREGIPSLRFDYHATGDSAGADGEGTLQQWRRDVVSAHEVLRDRSGVQEIQWLGLRLGATLAVDAARLGAVVPKRVILWDPVVEGREYLAELSAKHAFWTRQRGMQTEALGFLLPPALRDAIAAVDLVRLLGDPSPEVALIVGTKAPLAGRLVDELRRLRPGARCITTAQTTDWCSNEALGTQWVPRESVEAIKGLLAKEQVGNA